MTLSRALVVIALAVHVYGCATGALWRGYRARNTDFTVPIESKATFIDPPIDAAKGNWPLDLFMCALCTPFTLGFDVLTSPIHTWIKKQSKKREQGDAIYERPGGLRLRSDGC